MTFKSKNQNIWHWLGFALVFFIVSLPLAVQAQGTLKVGAAKRILTPDPLLPVSGGMGTPGHSTEKQGDLWVRAMVLENNGTRVAFVGIDNLGWPAALGDQSRALIQGIPAENILIGSTHTHSGPDAYGFPNEKGEINADMDYLNWCVQQIADAVNEAVANLESAELKTAVGEAKGKIAYNYYAPDLYDPRCGVIQAMGTSGKNKGKVIATLVNYAVHPEVIGAGRGITSPDLCGPLYDRIESAVGGVAIFMNGAQGGMVTADNRVSEGKEASDYEECRRIGYLLADQALEIISTAKAQTNPIIHNTVTSAEFVVDSPIMQYILQNSPHRYKVVDGNKVTTQMNLVNVGTAQILTIPGEALPNIGFYLKRKMKTDQAFLFGLTNDAFGYILTKEDFNSFKRYDYVSRTSLGEKTGPALVEHSLDLIDKSPAAEGFAPKGGN
ncbi:neutral/alkaline non-lysosomal ceramidase N-terminal domain-containing protein [Algoriphagus jejuensis]|uniref:Neutral/alkaline non-lysosomal ceramidase N-terminal domain-containing protein n=1 Tax=Algoriphagus jejuensis TaxID=419934 RepID=A0ABP3YC91_9BACT